MGKVGGGGDKDGAVLEGFRAAFFAAEFDSGGNVGFGEEGVVFAAGPGQVGGAFGGLWRERGGAFGFEDGEAEVGGEELVLGGVAGDDVGRVPMGGGEVGARPAAGGGAGGEDLRVVRGAVAGGFGDDGGFGAVGDRRAIGGGLDQAAFERESFERGAVLVGRGDQLPAAGVGKE